MDLEKQMMQETQAHPLEEEDDVLYCELRRQVLQLTAEDDDDDDDEAKGMAKARKQGATRPVSYDGWGGGAAAPAWIVNLWRNTGINGTGVFIPQGLHSRRRNRSKRKNDRGRTYRKVETTN